MSVIEFYPVFLTNIMSIFLHRLTTIVWFIFLVGSADLPAQQPDDAQFGMIPDSLSYLQPPPDNPDAPYIVTNKEMDVSFEDNDGSIIAILEHHVRLKVFDKTAREASIVAIPYYFDNNMENISEIRGITHLPDGEREHLQEKDIRTININSRYNMKEFSMPAVEEGAILEYSYVIQRRYIEELPDFFLSHRVPTAHAKVTITYPSYLRYQSFVENYDGELQHDFVYTDTSSVPKIFTIPQPPPIVTERWMAHDIPAVEEETYISSLDDYRGKIKFLLSEFGKPRQQLENNWEVVVAMLRQEMNPMLRIRNNTLASAIGDSIGRVINGNSKKAAQDSIYRFLNSRVNFSGAHSPFSQEADSTVLAGRAVDQAAINQTLLAMLQGAGIEAHPVLVSTRQSGKISKDFPSFFQFNAQMVYSRIGDETFLMDASFPHSQPDLVPVNMYNDEGLLLKQDSFEWIVLNPQKSKFDIQVDVDAQLEADGSFSGHITAHHRGYPAQLIRQQRAAGNSNSEILKRALFDGFSEIITNNVQLSHVNDFDNPVQISADFEISNYATSFTDGLEFRPMLVGYRMENPFGDSKRDLPVTLDAPEKLDVSYSIKLPAGHSIQTGKQNRTLSLPGAAFQETYNFQKDQMDYEYHINIEQKEFPADIFPQLYNLYERWVELSNTTWQIRK
jgi:hypothetical protein